MKNSLRTSLTEFGYALGREILTHHYKRERKIETLWEIIEAKTIYRLYTHCIQVLHSGTKV